MASKNSFFKPRKGQIEIGFNWIFIFIAGAAILLFFFFIILQERESSAEQLSYRIVNTMESVFSALESNPGAQQAHNRVSFELEFYCEEGTHSYGVSGSRSRAYLESRAVFTPRMLGASRIVSWTRKLNMPYPVTPVLYVSDERTKYIFLTDNEFIGELYRGFPANFTKTGMSASELNNYRDQGFRKYIIVSRQLVTIPNSIDSKSSLVTITPNSNYDLFGIVHFGTGQNSESTYFTREMLYGAIVSGEKDLYECNLAKILGRARIVSVLNLNRTQILHGQYDQPICTAYYAPATTQRYIRDILGNTSDVETFKSNLKNIYSAYTLLERVNEETRRTTICPFIY